MSNEVSKAIMFYYDSQNDSYKPIIAKLELEG